MFAMREKNPAEDRTAILPRGHFLYLQIQVFMGKAYSEPNTVVNAFYMDIPVVDKYSKPKG